MNFPKPVIKRMHLAFTFTLCLHLKHMKITLPILPIMLICLLVALTSQVHAAGFQLESIGSLDTTGYQYPEWWYSGNNPNLSGTASPNATITVTINDTSQTVTADANGTWSTPTTLSTGDHTITLASDSGNYTFTLHIGSAMPEGVGTPSAMTQPVAGNIEVTLAMFAIGFILLASGLKLVHKQST